MKKKDSIKFSIILPVYNAEKYVSRCLDSLCNQDYQNIEIIIVDDGSVDNTLLILNDYVKKYNNIKVLRQDNMGVAVARDNGLKKATGDYCMMVDADDWLESNAIKVLNDYILQFDGVDILKFRFKWEPSGFCNKKYFVYNKLMNNDELRTLRRKMLLTGEYNNIWNQVFRKSIYCFVKNGRDRIDYGEDILTNLGMIDTAKRVLFVNDVLYHYFKNQGSATHRMSLDILSKNIKDHVLINEEKIKYAKMFGFDDLGDEIFKKQALLFACDQIKKYMSSRNRSKESEMKSAIEASGLYDFIGDIELDTVRGSDKMICDAIVKKDFKRLRLIRPVIAAGFFAWRIRKKISACRVGEKE